MIASCRFHSEQQEGTHSRRTGHPWTVERGAWVPVLLLSLPSRCVLSGSSYRRGLSSLHKMKGLTFFFFFNFFIWLYQVLIAVCRILVVMGSSSLPRDRTQASCLGSRESQPLDHQGSPKRTYLDHQEDTFQVTGCHFQHVEEQRNRAGFVPFTPSPSNVNTCIHGIVTVRSFSARSLAAFPGEACLCV